MELPGKQLAEHQKQFRKIVTKAESVLRKGNLNSAIVWAQIAAHFAWERHPGTFYDLTLETILTDIANKIDESSTLTTTPPLLPATEKSKKTRVLHVITGCRGLGGHTLVVTGWIKNTFSTAVHSIVATTQIEPLPAELTSLAIQSGGSCTQLARYSSNLVERSLLLRSFRNWADLIVIHVNPSDALPNVAFGIEGGPPVLFLNHADDVFWLGVSIADVVLDIHPSAKEQSLKRRAVKNVRILPIPLNQPAQACSYETARQQLGIKPNTTVLLTVGRECKYLPIGTHNFPKIISKIVAKHPDVIFIAVGPENHDNWAKMSLLSKGRIRPMGGISWTNLTAYYASADIFLDSFPIGTGTAFLEAGMRGIPEIGLCFKEAPTITEGTDDIAFAGSNPFPSSVEAYESLLEKMISENSFFKEKAKKLKDQIIAHHCSPGWNYYLDDVMNNLPSKHSIWVPKTSDSLIEPVNNIIAEWDAEVLDKETPPETYARLIMSYANQLKKAEMLHEQTTTFMSEFLKKRNIKKVTPFLYRCKKGFTS